MLDEIEKFDYCTIGAGPSGLAVSYKLLKAGRKVLLLEKDARVGGLCKSFNYEGNIFDIGPKRFFTKDLICTEFIKEITQNKFIEISRHSQVYFFNKYFSWPLKKSDLFKMPISVCLKAFFEMVSKVPGLELKSFEEYIKMRYGKTLFNIFFEPYTKKFLRVDPGLIDADWAHYSLNRTLIDERLRSDNLKDIFKQVILKPNLKTKFLYPASGGFGSVFENIFNLCKQCINFEYSLGETICDLNFYNNYFHAKTTQGRELVFKNLIWSGNINDILRLTLKSFKKLPFINTIFYNFICKERFIKKRKAQWIYLSNKDTIISRITCMSEFAGYTCRNGYYNFVCELTDSKVDPYYFLNSKKYIGQIIQELKKINFLNSDVKIEDVKVEKVFDTYPVYYLGYYKDLEQMKHQLERFSNRLFLLGRAGNFWYNNSDHSIKMALALGEHLLEDKDTRFEYNRFF